MGSSTTASPPSTDTTQTTTSSVDSTSSTTTALTTTDAACGMSWDPCNPSGCCDGYICVGQADKSEVCCAVGDGSCYCACEGHEGLDAVPAACAALEVPPFDDFTEFAGWLEEPSVVRATSHATYQCSSIDLSSPFDADLECPCTGFLSFIQLALPDASFDVGETTATLTEVSASCRDVCSIDGNESPNVPFQILAVSETCVIGETVGLGYDIRVYVDRGACP
jgi:hypothetical protein